MNKCRSCEADLKGNYFCKPCSKEIRNILKDVKDFSDHVCPGHGSLGKKNIRIEATHYGFLPTRVAFLNKYIRLWLCIVCSRS